MHSMEHGNYVLLLSVLELNRPTWCWACFLAFSVLPRSRRSLSMFFSSSSRSLVVVFSLSSVFANFFVKSDEKKWEKKRSYKYHCINESISKSLSIYLGVAQILATNFLLFNYSIIILSAPFWKLTFTQWWKQSLLLLKALLKWN